MPLTTPQLDKMRTNKLEAIAVLRTIIGEPSLQFLNVNAEAYTAKAIKDHGSLNEAKLIVEALMDLGVKLQPTKVQATQALELPKTLDKLYVNIACLLNIISNTGEFKSHITGAFTWHNTPQGADYWINVQRECMRTPEVVAFCKELLIMALLRK